MSRSSTSASNSADAGTARYTARPALSWVIAGVFVAALLVPGIFGLLGFDVMSGFSENRNLAAFPASELKSLQIGAFTRKLDVFVGDHFGFRPALIRTLGKAMLQMHISTDRWVLIGQHGWLFSSGSPRATAWDGFVGPKRDWDEYRGTATVDPATLGRWRAITIARATWLERRGAHFIFAIPPDKEIVYSDDLPSWLQPQGDHTRRKAFMDSLTGTEVDVLDLAPALLQARPEADAKGETLYLKGDTHWNSLGALYAALAILKHLNQQFEGVRAQRIDDYRIIPYLKTTQYDLARQLGLTLTDTEYNVEPLGGWTTTESCTHETPTAAEFCTYTKEDSTLPRLLVYTDSFGVGVRRFLAESFGRAVFVNWWPAGQYTHETFPLDFIEKEKPNIFLYIRLERGILGPIADWRAEAKSP